MYRQGDILLMRVGQGIDPTDVEREREDGAVVLAHGEATGHRHRLVEPHVRLYEKPSKARLLVVKGTQALLRHEEHAPIEVPPGIYRVVRQREWTDEDEPRVVAD